MSAASTIAAIATGPARGGIAVVRVSGPQALAATLPLVPSVVATAGAPLPRHAYFGGLRDRAGQLLDEGLFLYFEGPHSFTGEAVVELQLHGSPELAALVLQAVLADGEVRLAEPGEFTRRAYLNGRLDLLRAEAVADLVAAQSEAQVRAAAAQLAGTSSRAILSARAQVADLLTDLEGVLNFPDEAEGVESEVPPKLAASLRTVEALAAQARQGYRARRGGRITFYGPPNAGKSTLFNRLLGTERALVDDAPGTTRDVLEAPLILGELSVTLVDTAGLRETPERLEALGMERALDALRSTDVAVELVPPGASPRASPALPEGALHLVVYSKADQLPASERERLSPGTLLVSVASGEGLEALRARLTHVLHEQGAAGMAFSERSLAAVLRSAESLHRAAAALASSTLEVVAGEVAGALEALDAAQGRDAPADVLDAVFRRFCIGK